MESGSLLIGDSLPYREIYRYERDEVSLQYEMQQTLARISPGRFGVAMESEQYGK